MSDTDQTVTPIKVQIVNTQAAPVERRSTMRSYVPGAAVCIIPLSNKRIHTIVNVVATSTGNTGQAFLANSQADANQASATYNAGSIIGPGEFEMVTTGEVWLSANGTTNYVVGVISEYEA